MSGQTLLVNGFYAGAVGHAIEMLHRALGYHLADPERQVSVLLNADMPTELADLAPFVDRSFALRHPILEPLPEPDASDRAFDGVPGAWDVIVDDHRRAEAWQFQMFPGLAQFYAASDRRLEARALRVLPGDRCVAYHPGGQLRLRIPEGAGEAARRRLVEGEGDGRPVVVVMPLGSSERSRYPSVRSWLAILDVLAGLDACPRVVLMGKSARDGRTTSTLDAGEKGRLLEHPSAPIDAFDLPFLEQVAIVEAADLFVAPHTGFAHLLQRSPARSLPPKLPAPIVEPPGATRLAHGPAVHPGKRSGHGSRPVTDPQPDDRACRRPWVVLGGLHAVAIGCAAARRSSRTRSMLSTVAQRTSTVQRRPGARAKRASVVSNAVAPIASASATYVAS